MSKPRVFILEPRGLDYSAAEVFGQLVFIFEHHRPSILSIEFQKKIEDALEAYRFEPEHDYILVSGSAINMYLLGDVIGDFSPRHQVLIWSADKSEYFQLEVGRHREETNEGIVSENA